MRKKLSCKKSELEDKISKIDTEKQRFMTFKDRIDLDLEKIALLIKQQEEELECVRHQNVLIRMKLEKIEKAKKLRIEARTKKEKLKKHKLKIKIYKNR